MKVIFDGYSKMDEDQTEKLIELIQSKPGLYDKSLKEYRDRIVNKTLWKEVCEGMLDTWSIMPIQEKKLKAKEIQQRWQNLRTCFKRELNKIKSVPLSKKRRKYIYYNQLSFLLTSMSNEEKETSSGNVTENVTPKVFENKFAKKAVETSTNQQQTPNISTERPKTEIASCEERRVWNNPPRFQNQHQPKEYKDDIDEDKTFLMSLVPSFRKMTDEQKIEAKIEFLSIIRRISRSNAEYANKTQANYNFVGGFPASGTRNFTHANYTIGFDPAMHSDVSQSSFLSSSNTNQPSDLMDVCQVKVEDA